MSYNQAEDLNQMLYALLGSSPDLISAVNKHMALTYYNQSYERVFEEVYGSKPILGVQVTSLYKDRPQIQSNIKGFWTRALSGETFTNTFSIHNPAQEQECYYEAKFAPIFRGEEIIGATQSIRDITDKVYRHREAEDNFLKLKGIIDSSKDCILTLNRALEVMAFNDCAKEHFKIRFDYSLKRGQNLKDANKKVEVLLGWFERAFEGEHVKEHLSLEGKDGPKDMDLDVLPLLDQNQEVIGATLTARDVTESVQDKQRLKKNAQFIEGVIKGAKFAMGLFDPELRLIKCNETFLEYFQWVGVSIQEGILLEEAMKEERMINNFRQAANEALKGEKFTVNRTYAKPNNLGDMHAELTYSPIIQEEEVIGFTLSIIDITQRVNQQQELLDKAELLNGVVSGALNAMAIFNHKFQFEAFNELFREDYKIHLEYTPQKGQCVLDHLKNDAVRESIEANGKKALAGEQVNFIRNMISASDGKEYFINVHYRPITDYAGEIIGFILSNEDITEKVLAEKKLLDAAKLLKAVMDGSQDAMAVYDADYNIVECDDQFIQLFRDYCGVEVDKGKNALEILKSIPELYENLSARGSLAMKGELHSYQSGFFNERLQRECFYQIVYSPVLSDKGEVVGFSQSNRDISEQVIKDKELSKAARLLKAVMNGAQDSMAVYDRNFNLIECNDQYLKEIKGSANIEIQIGENVLDKLAAHEDFQSKLRERGEKALKGEQHSYFADYYQEGLGKNKQFQIVYSPVLSDENEVIGFSQSNRDISEQFAKDQKLKESARLLKAVMNGSQDAMAVYDIDFKLIECDDYYADVIEDYTQYRPKKGERILERIEHIPDIHDNLKERGLMALQGKSVSFDRDYIRKGDGQRIYLNITYSPVVNDKGEVVGFSQSNRDITERVLAEQKNAKHVKHLNALFENEYMAYWEINMITEDMHFSPSYYGMLGYEKDEVEPSFSFFRTLMHPEDLALADERYFSHVKSEGKEDFVMDIRMKHKQGHWHWVHFSGQITDWNEEGQPIYIVGTNLDISERIKKREELANEAHKLQSIIDGVGEMIVAIDKGYEVVVFNSAYAKNFQSRFNHQLKVGDNLFQDISNAWNEVDLRPQLKEALEGESSQLNYSIVNAQGIETFFEAGITPVYGDKKEILGATLVLRDVTRRKLADIEIQQSAIRLQAIIDGTEDMIVALDKKYRFIAFNKQYKDFAKIRFGVDLQLGYRLQDLISEPEFEQINYMKGYWDRALKGESFVETLEANVDGSLKMLQLQYNPVLDEKGKVIGASQTARDITERLAFEETLKQEAAKVQSVLDGTYDSLITVDTNFNIIVANAVAKRHFKAFFGKDLTNGFNLLDEKSYQGKLFAEFVDEAKLALETGSSSKKQMTLFFGPDQKKKRVVEVFNYLVKGADDQILGLSQLIRDITDQVNYQENLRKAADTIQGVIDGSQDIISAVDRDLNFIAFNELFQSEVADLYDMKVAVGVNLRDALAHRPEELNKALEFYQSALEGKESKFTRETKGEGGESYFYDVTYLPMQDADGNIIGATHTVRNVTDRMRQNVELELLAAKLQGIMDGQSDGVAAIDANYNYLAFNKGYEEIIYKSIGQFPKVGQNIKALFEPTAIPSSETNWIRWQKALNGEHVIAQVDYPLGENFHTFELEYSAVKDKQGNILGAVQVAHDITEKVKIEREIQETASRLKAVIDGTSDIIASVDQDLRLTAFNDSYKRMVKEFCQVEVVIGMSFHEILSAHPEHLKRAQNNWSKAFNGDSFIIFSDQEDEDGQTRYFQAQYNPISNDDSEVIGAVHIIHDITSQKRAEFTLKESKEQLELKVKRRTQELTRTNYELKRINNYFDTYLYTAAHDLRSPVVNIKQFIGLLARISDLKKREAILDKIGVSVNRLEKTVQGLNQVLDVQKSENLDFELCSFEETVESTLVQLEHEIQASGADIKVEIESKQIYYIPAYLNSIVFNLVSNAIKYRHEDRQPEINISTYPDPYANGCYILRVQDNGMGMDLQKHGENLFAPFKRLTTEREGLGVGLNILKSIIEKNGGSISVSSTLGEGSTFKAHLKCYKNGNENIDC